MSHPRVKKGNRIRTSVIASLRDNTCVACERKGKRLIMSDSCFNKTADDKSGDNLESLFLAKSYFNSEIAVRCCISDDSEKIQTILKDWCDHKGLDLILTVGGTGFTERDVTPEATKAVIEKDAPGISIAMVQGSLKITPYAILSRIHHTTEYVTSVQQILQNNATESTNESKVDVSCVAKRPRHSIYPLVPVQDAQKLIIDECDSMNVIYLKFKDCLGFILAEDIFAIDNLPPFPASIKDGYAVIASDGDGKRKVLGDVTAGKKPDEYKLMSGNCIRISTGAPVPSGADAVVQVEDTELTNQSDDGKTEIEIVIHTKPKIGQDIRPVGSDIKKGELILSKQTKLGPAELGILAAVGPININVYKKPIIGILSTGNEIVEPGDDSSKGGVIRDSNKTTLLALFKTEDFSTYDGGIAKDNPEEIKMKLDKMFQNADVIVTTGGVSMGEKVVLIHNIYSSPLQYVKLFKISFSVNAIIQDIIITNVKFCIWFEHLTYASRKNILFYRKPTTFATVNYNGKKKLIFGLPGNPVSATVTCHLFVLPALRKISGYQNVMPTLIKAKLSTDVQLDPRPEYQRAHLFWQPDSNLPLAVVTGNQISSRLPSMHKANTLLTLPPCSETLKMLQQGTEVNALVIDKI
ncbi:gephyrin-like [Centruroides sculpturatus]|uniref:gephyrin-like n=1 Tax=Centruroides sculpturatus TaxID=218467 RepID=UPI000C6E9F9E|nr:gephyrin-like [Centruroides sculpturatus]